MILGSKVKMYRKKNKFTQKELADGICTQVTISKIENFNKTPNMKILTQLCSKLGVDLYDIYLNDSESSKIRDLFSKIDDLCSAYRYKEAYRILKDKINFEKLDNSLDKKYYHYYLGMIQMNEFKNYDEALYSFNYNLIIEPYQTNELIDIYAKNEIGVVYYLMGDYKKALDYFDQSVKELEKFENEENLDWKKFIRLYFNTANYYSKNRYYERALDLCTKCISIVNKTGVNTNLEMIYYEMGYNSYHLDKLLDAKKSYFLAIAFARLNNNLRVLKTIKDNIQEYQLDLSEMLLLDDIVISNM